jgi:type II secretory pathway predicted ATPase ExeA
MLARYFGFEENPFGATPDPRYLYSSATHREALASLQFAFYGNRGFTALIAQPGMGKTTLLFEYLRLIRGAARSAFLFQSQLDSIELLKGVLREVGIAPRDTMGQILEQLNEQLINVAREGRRFVLVVDEAQNLSESSLETLRLLTNFETTRAKLMQIVLSGQPQLADKLLRPNLVQLRQRISTNCRLDPLSREDVAAYVLHRLKVAGYTGSDLFTSQALDRIADATEGIPRNINTLCFNALSLCCALGQKRVTVPIVEEAIGDLQLNPTRCEPAAEPPKVLVWGAGAPDWHKKKSRTRVPAVGLILLAAVALASWADHFYEKSQLPKESFIGAAAQQPSVTPGSTDSINHISALVTSDPLEVTVNAQQTLSAISVDKLGHYDSDVLREIQNLNPEITDPNLIHPGQRIVLPRHAMSQVTPDPNKGMNQ